MKSFLIPFLIIILGGAAIGGLLLFEHNKADKKITNTNKKLKTAELSIKNMYCVGCKRSIESAIGSIKGVKDMQVSLSDDSGRVLYDPDKISAEKVVSQSIFKTYPAKVKSVGPHKDDDR